jgi:hypothetical protein
MKMKITKRQLRRLIRESLSAEMLSGHDAMSSNLPSGEPTIQELHPLLDGLYLGNGTVTSVFSRKAEVMETLKNNTDNKIFQLALSIIEDNNPLPYLPFKFDSQVIRELEKYGVDPDVIDTMSLELMSEDSEYNPPGW